MVGNVRIDNIFRAYGTSPLWAHNRRQRHDVMPVLCSGCEAFQSCCSLYRLCARRPCWRTKTIEDVCIKIEYISQRKIIVLFWSSNMAVVHTLY